ncbi:LysR family transcriptional regulator [Bradyrhizobium sp. USDA 223]|uniref:LysR family transcriptional regulator n=1 Tax=Bradyrhizobium sp. USDA 223 TaxID=3156306 RepID=UPI003836AC0B
MQWNERIGRRLKLRDLHVLLAVVQRGTMARAANELAMSQPAVSKAIADMERELGIRLLDRTPRGVEPTNYGRVLVKRGLAIFDELRQGVQELEFLADPSVGELRIGSSEGMAAGVLPAIIREISRRHPRIVINVAQALFATTQYRDLQERSVDLLFGRVFGSPPPEEGVVVEKLFDDHVVVVVGKHHPLARSRRLTLADLAEQRWILPPPSNEAGRLAAEIFISSGLKLPHAPVTTISIHLALRLLVSERFVAFLPGSVLRFGGYERMLSVLPVKLPVQQRPVGAIMLKDRTLSPLVQVFLECARQTVDHPRARN